MKYKTKAQKLIDSGFWMAGMGNFNLTIDEIADILKLIEKEDFKSLVEMYERLLYERMGDE